MRDCHRHQMKPHLLEEKALILELPDRMCASDGDFIDDSTKFDRVHVSSNIPALLDALNAAVGRQVTVRGQAFGAHTTHHRAPSFCERSDRSLM
ncbi:MAG: hypothetical protein JSS55_14650 [Proteobacteria bacterium]|nr:hypothetical protein [Pseudomonadota bacterium]